MEENCNFRREHKTNASQTKISFDDAKASGEREMK